MLRYTVTILDRNAAILPPSASLIRRVEGVTLTKARRIAERAARRGVKLYGGSVERYNWGTEGGFVGFMRPCRSASITMDLRSS